MINEIQATTQENWEGRRKMPWTGKSFQKHNKGLSEGESAQASKVANAILDETGDEGKAIRIANWQAKKKRKSHSAHGKTRKSGKNLRRADYREAMTGGME